MTTYQVGKCDGETEHTWAKRHDKKQTPCHSPDGNTWPGDVHHGDEEAATPNHAQHRSQEPGEYHTTHTLSTCAQYSRTIEEKEYTIDKLIWKLLFLFFVIRQSV